MKTEHLIGSLRATQVIKIRGRSIHLISSALNGMMKILDILNKSALKLSHKITIRNESR